MDSKRGRERAKERERERKRKRERERERERKSFTCPPNLSMHPTHLVHMGSLVVTHCHV